MHIPSTTFAIFGISGGELVAMIPIVAIVMTFGSAMLKFFFDYRKRTKLLELHHQQRMAAIDKGIDLPPLPHELLRDQSEAPEPPPQRGHGTLMAGLIVAGAGVGLFIPLHYAVPRMDNGGDIALFALIPIGIGVAFLVYYFAVGRKLALAAEEARKNASVKLASKQ